MPPAGDGESPGLPTVARWLKISKSIVLDAVQDLRVQRQRGRDARPRRRHQHRDARPGLVVDPAA